MNEQSELHHQQALANRPKEQALDVRRDEGPDIATMLKAVIEKGITQESVAAVDAIARIYERQQDRNAEREFNAAFVALQRDLKSAKIQATKPVVDRNQAVKYKFAPLEEIMEAVGPYLEKNGFAISFGQGDAPAGKLTQICRLMHIGGHKQDTKFTISVGSGPPNATPSQADGSASQYAKRYAVCDALMIVIQHLDDDARADGDDKPITKEQADGLRERVRATAANEAAFLKFAGAKTYEEIPAARYGLLDDNLRRKEKTV